MAWVNSQLLLLLLLLLLLNFPGYVPVLYGALSVGRTLCMSLVVLSPLLDMGLLFPMVRQFVMVMSRYYVGVATCFLCCARVLLGQHVPSTV